MFFTHTILLIIASSQLVLCMELCKSSEWWYDDVSGKCLPCQVCDGKSFFMAAPCSDYVNTLCIDLTEVGLSVDRSIERGRQLVELTDMKRPKWHETEALEQKVTDIPQETASIARSVFEDFQNQWGHIVIAILCVTLFFIAGSVIILVLRVIGKRLGEKRKNIARARLFSRDRLNTTEYMNNLATLDRRLAMDEILEKRKKAIFEPHLLQENIYTDEVFVDISGLPRSIQNDHEYDELDHRRCLLRMQDQQ